MKLVYIAHSKFEQSSMKNGLFIDGTAGNGYDTHFLAKLAYPNGKVWAFDIQDTAIKATLKRLESSGLADVVTACKCCHSQVASHITKNYHGIIDGAMLNLGYLPGRNHDIKTTPQTTTAAILAIYKLLRKHAKITILCYRGHVGGQEEADVVHKLCSVKDWQMETDFSDRNKPESPILFTVRKI
jgi:predicted methyltransferase